MTHTAHAQGITYPVTRKVDQVDTYHGVTVADPYRWLEDDNAPETAAWVTAENAVTNDYLSALPMRSGIRARLTELWNFPRQSPPMKRGDRYFFFKNDGLQNHAILYMQTSLQGSASMVIDPNGFSSDGTVALSAFSISDDGRLLAYGTSSGGSDWQELHVRDIDGGNDLPDVVRWVKFSGITWTKDGRGFFYGRYPAPEEGARLQQQNQFHKLYYHRLGTAQEEDVLIHERADNPSWLFFADITEDGRYLVIYASESGPNTMVSLLDLRDPMHPELTGPIVPIVDTFEAANGVIGNDGATIYMQTNLRAPRGRVVSLSLEHPERSAWRELVPETKDVIDQVSLVGNELIVTYRHDAHNVVRFFDLEGRPTHDLELPTIGSVGGVGGRRSDTELFYVFTSYLYPTTIFRYDVATRSSTLHWAPSIDFDPTRFETEQIWFTSKDGTRVPMFVTHRKGIAMDGSNPTLLYGYGGFNVSLTPTFSVSNLVWMENGGVFVVVSLRGGGEFGEEWHLAGTKERKQNVFDDFIGAAEYLIAKGYTSPAKLAMQGGSNGGLLVGAVMCQRPDLMAVALPAVGVMDMLRYQKFTIGAAWKSDYGLSDDPEEFTTLHAYSPLHNLKPGTAYPATLVTTADHDDRVVPAHSFKFAARLQECQAGPAPVLIRVETRAGHGGGKPISMLIDETADVLSFAMANLGVDAAPR